ncbi:50S ribosomal protein L37ae [Candidatus Woesearchaeota archaeon]|nr:50S ribosomal protein L37ae [Candidatus Woesearchaeota archaeon]
MKSEEKLGSVKRFGARYGRKLKLKLSKIEAEQRKLHKCPYCSKTAVRRVALGIWQCRKCNAKFAGKAYSVTKRILMLEEDAAEAAPAIVEAKEGEESSQEE